MIYIQLQKIAEKSEVGQKYKESLCYQDDAPHRLVALVWTVAAFKALQTGALQVEDSPPRLVVTLVWSEVELAMHPPAHTHRYTRSDTQAQVRSHQTWIERLAQVISMLSQCKDSFTRV